MPLPNLFGPPQRETQHSCIQIIYAAELKLSTQYTLNSLLSSAWNEGDIEAVFKISQNPHTQTQSNWHRNT